MQRSFSSDKSGNTFLFIPGQSSSGCSSQKRRPFSSAPSCSTQSRSIESLFSASRILRSNETWGRSSRPGSSLGGICLLHERGSYFQEFQTNNVTTDTREFSSRKSRACIAQRFIANQYFIALGPKLFSKSADKESVEKSWQQPGNSRGE